MYVCRCACFSDLCTWLDYMYKCSRRGQNSLEKPVLGVAGSTAYGCVFVCVHVYDFFHRDSACIARAGLLT